MKNKETREWPAPPARGKYRNTSAAAKPAPRPEDFDSDRQYRDAYMDWWRKSENLPREQTRVLDKDGAHERVTGLIPASGYLSRYERNTALAEQQDSQGQRGRPPRGRRHGVLPASRAHARRADATLQQRRL